MIYVFILVKLNRRWIVEILGFMFNILVKHLLFNFNTNLIEKLGFILPLFNSNHTNVN